MRSALKKRLESLESVVADEADWKKAASRRMLLIALHDPHFAEMARKPHLVGTPPELARQYEAEATTYLVSLCRTHGEYRYANLIAAESSDDTN